MKKVMLLLLLVGTCIACPKNEGGPKDPNETSFTGQPTQPTGEVPNE